MMFGRRGCRPEPPDGKLKEAFLSEAGRENPAAATEDPDPWEDLYFEERRQEVRAAMPELESWV